MKTKLKLVIIAVLLSAVIYSPCWGLTATTFPTEGVEAELLQAQQASLTGLLPSAWMVALKTDPDLLPLPENELKFSTSEPNLSLRKTIQTDLNPEIYFKSHLKQKKIENTLFESSLITLSLLNIADYISTTKALKYPGLEEGNPFMKPFVKNDTLFAAIKAGVSVSNYYLLKKIHRKNKTLAWILSAVSNAALTYVVVHNYQMIEKAKNR